MVLVMDGSKESAASKHHRNGDLNESAALLREISSHLKQRSFQDIRTSTTLAPLSVEPTQRMHSSTLDTNEAKIIPASESFCDGILSEVSCKQLRRLLLLHLDLIEEQQKQMIQKDKTISRLKNDKEQLEAKISRMERRLVLGTKSVGKASNTETSKTADREKSAKRLSTPCTTDTTKKVKRHSNVGAVMVSSKQFKDHFADSYLQTSGSYLHSNHKEMPIVPSATEDDQNVLVPGWKVLTDETQKPSLVEDNCSPDETEELCEDTFLKRHQRLEADERRRKRWDMQRLRQEHMQEALKQKQRCQEQAKKGIKEQPSSEVEQLDSLTPPLNRLLQVEVCNEVPVSAFGCQIASLQSSEFSVPWFDVDKRELHLRKQNEKYASSGRGRRRTFHA